MLRQVAKHFGTGLVTVLPFALVIWVVVMVFDAIDGLLEPIVRAWVGYAFPGAGFLLVMLAVTTVGALTRMYVSRRIIQAMDRLFANIPLVKSLYTMFKEIIRNLVAQRKGFHRAVLVQWPDERAWVVGLVTQEQLPSELDPAGDKVSVYLPNAFQFAGVTVIVERARTKPCPLSAEAAFKFAISAGLGHPNVWVGLPAEIADDERQD